MKEECKVFIRGNKDRGEEVIKALTDLGGNNGLSSLKGSDEDWIYFINSDGAISSAYLVSEIAKIIMDNYREIILPGHWEDGDILINKGRTEYTIFRKYSYNTMFYNYDFLISIDKENHIWYRISGEEKLYKIENFRLATSEEIKQFHALLNKMHKDWDAEKKQLVDLRWKPKINEKYWIITTTLDVNFFTWKESPTDIQMFDSGNCFKTKEEAEIAAEKIKKLLNAKS